MNPSFVLDCSVTMAWCFEDEASRYTDAVLDSLKHTKALVPILWQIEVANVLLMAEKKGRIQEASVFHFTHLLHQLPIEKDSNATLMADLISFGRLHQLTSYDSCYLHLALSFGLPIATLDEKLRNAAQKAGASFYLAG